MTGIQLGKLWTTLSLVLTYYAVNSWIVTQGGNEVFGAKLVVSGRAPAALMALPICTVLLIVTSLVGRTYARRAAGIDWHGRVPVVGFDGIETGSTEGRLFQGGMLLALSILPAASLFHFWHVTLTSRVAPTADLKASIPGIWDWSHFGWNDPARICSDADATSPCLHNSTVLPGLEPTLLAILTAVGLLALVAHLHAVFGPHPGRDVDPASSSDAIAREMASMERPTSP